MVVGVKDDLVTLFGVRSEPDERQFRVVVELGHGESGRYETVLVDDLGRDIRVYVLDALDVLADVLARRDQQARRHQDDERETVVQTEDGRIDANFAHAQLDGRRQTFERTQHDC